MIKLAPYLIGGFAIAALLLGAAALVNSGLGKIRAMEAAAAKTAGDARDAYWRAEIEKANAEVARVRQNLAEQALKQQDLAARDIAGFEGDRTDLEKQNEALAEDDDRCGLSRDRVQLLVR
ncbi:hypothetical protein [Rhizobium halophytocola]|uniref:DUF3552 domain-containing protein n=1 Tax=Rhizobium halophytocola TaxID=735519 RepID=A0ABS4E428_9HYPH|nr:hypothetical protein [Rhizobium halophytocola]MBP1852701.1 hypothetical protein [Rhizobium halophytocola]